MAVAVVERFKQESMYGLSAKTKKSGRCGGGERFCNEPLFESKNFWNSASMAYFLPPYCILTRSRDLDTRGTK